LDEEEAEKMFENGRETEMVESGRDGITMML
jgi:hypothetical protein